MYGLIPLRGLVKGRREQRLLTLADLAFARQYGPVVTAEWDADHGAFARVLAFNLALSAIGPLVGIVGLGWSMAFTFLAIGLDVVGVCLADWVRALSAGEIMHDELRRAERGERILAIAESLRRGRWLRPMTQVPRVWLEEFRLVSDGAGRVLLGAVVLALGACTPVLMLGLVLIELGRSSLDAIAVVWLFVPLLLRVAEARRTARRAREHGGPQPAMFPQSFAAAWALYASWPVGVFGAALLAEWIRDRQGGAALAMALAYAAISAAFAWFGYRMAQARVRRVRAFLAEQPEQQQARLRSWNGADAS